VAVILDSAVGLHQGGQVSAPVFRRVAQQVLEYLHTPHDVELPPNRQLLMAERQVKEQDLAEGSPDRLGDTVDVAEATVADPAPVAAAVPAKPSPEVSRSAVVPAALRQPEPESSPATDRKLVAARNTTPDLPPAASAPLPSGGTVILDAEQGGILVPSFLGKSVRAAVELSEESGLDLDAVGSGIAREQSPAPGTHIASGSRVTVKFGR
jgi:cell division protein FtsI (penicillin-binding protein 3)